MLKKFRVIILLIFIVTALTVTAQALEPERIVVRIRFNGGEIKTYESSAETVSDFLRERKITLDEKDRVVPGVSEDITKGIIIDFYDAFDVTVVIDGEETTVTEPIMTVSELVAKLKKETGLDLKYDNNLWSKNIHEGMLLELKSYKTETIEEKTPIDFDVNTVYNDTVDEGTETVLTEGQNGERTVITEIEYLGGVETGRNVLSDEITMLAISKVIEIGTAPIAQEVVADEPAMDDETPFEYESVYTMEATAYTSDYASTGKRPGDKYFGITASGMKAQVGVVAVDPKVIPLGTNLYIDGYGYAIAGDTGGAIKGHKIDLYFNTNSECMTFGRQQITVYVLKDN